MYLASIISKKIEASRWRSRPLVCHDEMRSLTYLPGDQLPLASVGDRLGRLELHSEDVDLSTRAN
jgi:hypothetical protein